MAYFYYATINGVRRRIYGISVFNHKVPPEYRFSFLIKTTAYPRSVLLHNDTKLAKQIETGKIDLQAYVKRLKAYLELDRESAYFKDEITSFTLEVNTPKLGRLRQEIANLPI